MNITPKSKCILFTGIMTLLPGIGHSKMEISNPVHVPQSLVTFSIPDVHSTLDAVQILADQILPPGEEQNLKSMLGDFIGDPELRGIPDGSSAGFVWDGVNTYGFLSADAGISEKLVTLSQQMQFLSAFEKDLFIFSKSPAGLETGIAGAHNAMEMLSKNKAPALVLNVQTAELVKKFRPQLNMMTMMLPTMMMQGMGELPQEQQGSMKSMAKILEAEVRVLISLATQIESLEITILPKMNDIKYQYVFSAVRGTDLHSFLTAPNLLTRDPLISTDYLSPGTLEMELFMSNPEALTTFLTAESEKLVKNMNLDPDAATKWIEMVEFWPVFFSGSVAETVDLNAETGISMEFLASTQTEGDFLDAMKKMNEMMTPMTELYADMGMPMQFDLMLDIRKYKGSSIHQYDFIYELDQMEPAMAQQIRSINMAEMKSEFTVRKNRVFWTMGDTRLNHLIDRLDETPSPQSNLHARKTFSDGGFSYFDLNISSYLDYISSLMPETDAPDMLNQISKNLKDSPPLTAAGFQQEDKVQFGFNVPVTIIEQVVSMFWAVKSTP